MCNQVHSVSDLRRIRQQYLNFIKTHPPSKDNANVASMFVQFLNNNLYSIVIFFLLLENNKTMSSDYHSKMSYSCYTQYTLVLSPRDGKLLLLLLITVTKKVIVINNNNSFCY